MASFLSASWSRMFGPSSTWPRPSVSRASVIQSLDFSTTAASQVAICSLRSFEATFLSRKAALRFTCSQPGLLANPLMGMVISSRRWLLAEASVGVD